MKLFSKPEKTPESKFLQDRQQMVERQLAGRDIKDESVLEAMRKVPRHLFVPSDVRGDAYMDSPLPIGYGQTISQPYIVGIMTDLLSPDKNKTVLEIGTGSGYQTAILAELFSHVDTVEYIPDLSRRAQQVLEQIGYQNITFHIGDGLKLPESDQLFDVIIVTAAPDKIPDELLARLQDRGKMVIPVGGTIQYLKLISKLPNEKMETQTLHAVRFVPLQG